MMNVRLKLREPKTLISPQGPSFSFGRTIRTTIMGSELCFKAPRHRPRNSNEDPVFPDREYRPEKLGLSSSYNDQDAAAGRKDIFLRRKIFSHSWAFYGPWFTGIQSLLHCHALLYRPVNYPKQFSLFHPRALESVIGDYLGVLYGDHLVAGENNIQKFVAPLNWTPLLHLPVNAVKLDVKEQDFFPGRERISFVFLPLANDLMISMYFYASCLRNLPKEKVDKLIHPQPMYDMIDQIVNSIQLKLSPEAEAQQAKAFEGLEDTSLVKKFPPLKWDKLDEQQTQAVLLKAKS